MNYPHDFLNKVHCADSFKFMKMIPSGVIDMCITSPPYWGLRDYGIEQIFGGDRDCEHEWDEIIEKAEGYTSKRRWQHGISRKDNPEKWDKQIKTYDICLKCQAWKGQLGLEPTPEMYIEHLTETFNEVKRVLKKEGTLWLNIGDTYNASGYKHTQGKEVSFSPSHNIADLPQKCLCMIPERLAWSLIQNGWILRNKIIWYKPNAMPSSVTDRFSNRWECVFMFSKNNKTILWQHEKTKEWIKEQPSGTKGIEGIDWEWRDVGNKYSNSDTKIEAENAEQFNSPRGRKYREIKRKKVSLWNGFTYYFDLDAVREPHAESSVSRSEYPVGSFSPNTEDGHIKLATKGNQDRTMVEINPLGKNPGDVFEIATQPFPEAHFAVFPEKLCEKPIKAGCPEGGIVLDPFCGAGTALYVAKEMRRRFIGIDIKREYCDMSKERLAQGVL